MNKIYYILSILAIIQLNTLSRDITVTPGGSIKSAIDLSENGDVIMVKEGTYRESDIKINKSIELRGENYPVIDGYSSGGIITVLHDSVTIKGFSIINSGFSGMTDYAAIRLENASYCILQDNRLVNNYFGIFLANSNYCNINGNRIISNAVSETSSGNGIHLWKCRNNEITGNSITGHRDGIYFEFVTSSRVKDNTSFKNLRYGLHFMFSNDDEYLNNIFSDNGAGVAVMYTKNVKMINNRFELNRGSNSYGLLLKEISDSRIEYNTFSDNTVGIYAEGGTRINIYNNNFTGNGYACRILGNCSDDTVKGNNYLNNTFDITTNSSRNSNVFTGNYWDKYRGYDLDNNGTGDVPYRPVSLFSKIVEETPESVFLIRSFVADLLDMAEKVVPVFTPESLVDENPQMNPLTNTKY